ncbi:uncharacterized protein LOC132261015 [Phlebotomus argentipes]|uniref:uncharacterized protein LOC132261015 n=1 Tax=Phlebotomus argentipes TaxID=94469 RepID=UPI00289346E3|nr:uncharacterized protein LOC132261015 [Phlebotomus argentipes]
MDSKQNSILALDDDCLFTVFTYLNILDLMETEKVCQRFKSIAEMVYKTKHKLDYEVLLEEKLKKAERTKQIEDNFTLEDVENISQRLGPYVHTLNACSLYFLDSYCTLHDILKDFSNLRHLNLTKFKLNQRDFQLFNRIFVNLRVIQLEDCDVTDDIEVCLREAKHLESLDLSCNTKITGKCLTVLRNIKQINLDFCSKLELSHFTEFCELNQGLQGIKIDSFFLTNDFFSVIATHLQNLERVRIVDLNTNQNIDLAILGDLPGLKVLEFLNFQEFNMDSCLLKLAVWNTLEHLSICSSHFTQRLLRALCSFTKLKVLKIKWNQEINDANLIQMSLSENFQSLQEFEIYYCHQITDNGIVEFIRNCRELTQVELDLEYNMICNVIKRILPFLNERKSILTIIVSKRLLKKIPLHMRDQMCNPKIKVIDSCGQSF